MQLLAQIKNPVVPKLSPPDAANQFSGLLKLIISSLFAIGGLVFMIWFIFGAIRWITSGGDKQKLEEARQTLTNAVVGLVILFSLFAILKLIEGVFGIQIFVIDLGKIKL